MIVYIHDDASTFSSADIATLQGEAARWPFTLHVLTRATSSKAELASLVHQCITGPDIVCVGLDAANHRTETHFGTATGVRPQDFNSVAAAGNASFKTGNWRGGIEAIADQAKVSTQASSAVVVVQQAAPESLSPIVGWSIVAVAAWLVAAFIVWRVRKQQRDLSAKLNADMAGFREETEQLRSRNSEEQDWHDKYKAEVLPNFKEADLQPNVSRKIAEASEAKAKRYADRFANGGVRVVDSPVKSIQLNREPRTPADVFRNPPTFTPPPVIVNQSSDVSNLVAGYALGRLDATPTRERVIEREVVREEPATTYTSSWTSGSDSDSGGSGSTYDYGSSSSSDGGGGGSIDFGGGGGGDSGGGASDF